MKTLLAPFDGAIIGLDQFDDPVFKEELMGSGIGIRPDPSCPTLKVYAPVSGTVIKTMPHAFLVQAQDVGILVHIGIDTVFLHGDGFTSHVQEGQEITQGQLCFEVDSNYVCNQGHCMDTAIVILDSSKGTYSSERTGQQVHQGDVLLTV